MKDTFLKIAGVKTEKEFYKKYPTEEAFFSAHPEAMQMKHGGAVDLNAFYNQPRFIQTNIYEDGGDIHLDPSKKGTFKAQATRMGMGVQEAAAHILANKEEYSPEMVKKAVFAHNFAKEFGGGVNVGDFEIPKMQWAGEFMYRNNFHLPSTPAATTPSVVLTDDQKKLWQQNQTMYDGTPIKVDHKDQGETNFTGGPPVSGTPISGGAAFPISVPTPPAVSPGLTTPPLPASGTPIDLSGAKGPKVNEVAPFKMPAQEAPQGFAAWREKQMPKTFTMSQFTIPAMNDKPTVTDPTPKTQTTQNTQKGVTSYWQPVAEHQVFGDKTYRKLNDWATMPLYNPAVGMLSDNGLAGYIKMGLGAAAGISGMATGLDNIWRGFQGRKQPVAPVQTIKADIKEAGQTNFTGSQPPTTATPIDLSNAKGAIQNNPLAWETPTQKVAGVPMKEYGGMYKAADGVDLSKKPEFDPTKVNIGQTERVVDLQGGLNRALGANMGISMFNNTLGYKQGMKAVRENSVKAGMTDFGYQPDDTNWMPMGYDTLNTGPGQTQAPNLYTPVQYAGMQMTSQYQEGGEYDLTEEEIQQILAEGGEIEFM